MNIRETLSRIIARAAAEVAGGACIPDVMIDTPRVKAYGDYASNIALSLAKTLRRPPMEIANDIVSAIGSQPVITKIEVKPPGFINIFVRDASAAAGLAAILKQGALFGRSGKLTGKRAIVEFVSANPTGPLHIGHARNAAVGDCIARALERAGCSVWREYYYNDGGVQMTRLGESLKARYLLIFLKDIEFPEDGYHGDYIGEIAAQLHAEVKDSWKDKSITEFSDYAKDWIVKLIDADMIAMGINFDAKFNEGDLYTDGRVDAVISELRGRGKVYDSEGALWLRTTSDGDEKDRVLIKSDATKTYLAPDIAYHADKYSRGYDLVINLLGADHHNYVIRLRAAMRALDFDPEKLNCIIYQLVTVKRGGEVVKFGKRAGDYITLHEMISELGQDAVRFFFNMRRSDSHMVFDWDLAKEHSVKNPVYSIQYAHARCCSIERKAAELGIMFAGAGACDYSLLTAHEEQELIRSLAEFPRIVELAGTTFEPHHYTTYLRTIAEQFNAYFTAGNVTEEMRVILPGNPALSQARLALILATRVVLRNALDALGISAPEKM
ncbi:MAG: arginine--tRNA ligase [Candidatus Sumerlaeota bacterium]|nr:arginine--tRNA ligase [Candidatus Sumerlaeota bacterium]